jgi:hypothetical protein
MGADVSLLELTTAEWIGMVTFQVETFRDDRADRIRR